MTTQSVTHNTYRYQNWMSSSTSMNSLTLGEIVWPGSHNSGMDDDFSYPPHHRLLAPWVVCQNGPFIQQLNQGVRAFDLRLQSDEHWLGIKKFQAAHGPVSGRPVSYLIKSLDFFLEQNPDEFIILDIHHVEGTADKPFDYKTFNDEILAALGHRFIPYDNRHLTLGRLKALSRTQRVMIAARSHPDLDRKVFWPNIRHKWSGSDLTSPSELKEHIASVMVSPPSGVMPWSLSATSYQALPGVYKITEHLNEWFGPDSDWAPKCSIINADFIEESRLIDYCWEVNVSKGLLKK
ncbi:phospholipase [Pseudomonas sp. H3(2019)]|uniref:phospholipase n=1 Tax=Pseudomonas sp. H3(2019) TaxID=2598724 RepID=UPI0011945110|nr:phospholipase [Pseudomonas sp. H3(2019)]TVT84415.1 phospholipase [Pseudomonas sp. H3(2019)]